jgi:predicted Zn-dependent peptidase
VSEFQSTRLGNGLQIVGEPLPGVQSAAVAVFVGHGSVDDRPEDAGLAHLTESTMFRGTATRSSREITEQLDRIGAHYSSSTSLEVTLFSSLMLGNHLGETLDVLLDVVRDASFPDDELEPVRALQLQEIGQRNDQPAQLAMDLGRQQYFAGHPLGHDGLGSLESVGSLRRDQVVAGRDRWYQPGSTVVALAGNFDWPDVVDHVGTLTEGWTGSGNRWASTTPTLYPETSVIEMPGAQENLCFTFPAVSHGDPDYYPAALASTVLGSGMNSRLFMEVREKRGLAYSVGARFDAMSSIGLVRVYVGTQPERAAESVEVIRSELALLESEGVTDAELILAKTRLKARVIMGSESTGNRVMNIGWDWFYEGRYRPLSEIREAIDAVTRDDILRYLKRIRLTEQLGLVCLGPLSASELGVTPTVPGQSASIAAKGN